MINPDRFHRTLVIYDGFLTVESARTAKRNASRTAAGRDDRAVTRVTKNSKTLTWDAPRNFTGIMRKYLSPITVRRTQLSVYRLSRVCVRTAIRRHRHFCFVRQFWPLTSRWFRTWRPGIPTTCFETIDLIHQTYILQRWIYVQFFCIRNVKRLF